MAESSTPDFAIPPGFLRNESARSAKGRYVDGNNVRFVNGKAEKMGGNVRLTTAPMVGVPRGSRAWNDLLSRQLVAVGTASKLYVTPDVTWTPEDITPTDFLPGQENPAHLVGYGVGGYGLSGYGTARTDGSFVIAPPLYWALDHFGKLLLAAPLNGKLYYFDPSAFPQMPAQPVVAAVPGFIPGVMNGMFVTEERIVICFGTDSNGAQDLMEFWASAQGTFDNFDFTAIFGPNGTPSVVGRLQNGRRIMAGVNLGAQMAILWTDTATYLLQYTGSTFAFNRRGVPETGLVGPLAFVAVAGKAYWASNNSLFQYSSGIAKIPNSDNIIEWVLKQIRKEYTIKTLAFYNQRYDEVWFIWVVGSDTEPSVYAVFQRTIQEWYTGILVRTSAARLEGEDSRPILAGADGHLYLHDEGKNDNGQSMPWFMETSPVELPGGKGSMIVDGFIADMERQVGDIAYTLTSYDRTPATMTILDQEAQTLAPDEGYAEFRLEGRHIKLRMEGTGLECDFRMGTPKVEFRSKGTRK